MNYGYIRHKSYSLRACWYTLTCGSTREGHKNILCVFKIFGICQWLCYMLGIRYNLLYVHSILSMYIRCTLDRRCQSLVVNPETSQLLNIQYVMYMLGTRSICLFPHKSWMRFNVLGICQLFHRFGVQLMLYIRV